MKIDIFLFITCKILVYVLCRRGNDSQRAIVLLKEKFGNFPLNFINVSGGLHSYSKHIDSGFPVY